MPQVSLNNSNFYYESYGEGEAILFLHGLGSSSQDWEKQIEELSKEYKIYLLDLRGHGKSSIDGNFSFELFIQDIELFINQIIKEPFHLVGLSLGAMLASSLASKQANIKSLTLINCPLKINLDSIKMKIQFYLRVFIIKLFGMKSVAKIIAPKLFPLDTQKNLREIFIKRWEKNDIKAYLSTMKALIGFDITKYTKDINCKTFIISAENDYFPLKEKEIYSKQIKNSEIIVIDRTHHALPFEAAEKFNKILLKKLNSLK